MLNRIIILFLFSYSLFIGLVAEENKPIVIFLNGTSSAGKSSIANQLSGQLPEPYLKVGIDWYFGCLNPKFFEHGVNADQGYKFVSITDAHGPKTTVEKGPLAIRLDNAAHLAMKVFLQHGFNLIVDEVLLDDETFRSYLSIFQDQTVYFFAIKPPLEIAQMWEAARGDRLLGLARGLYDAVYTNKSYDLEIDSSKHTPEESAKIIIDYIKRHPNPTAFKSNL